MRFLILGSKEFPVGASNGKDVLPSGGMETYTEGLVKALVKEKQKVAVVTRDFGSGFFERVNEVDVHRVKWVKGFLLRNPSFNLNAFLTARRVKYDVCIANGVFASLVGIALRKLNGKKVIARPAGIAWVQPQYNAFVGYALRVLEGFAYKHADAVVFLSEEEKKSFKEKMGFLPKKHEVIYTGVDVKTFEKASGKKMRRQYGGKIVLYAGRLIGVKGVEYLVEAMKKVDAQLLIAGKGPDEEKLLERVKKDGMEGKVIFIGARSNVPELLKAADVFVLPSLSEGLPIVLLEAMAAGTPCVVTDIGLPVEDGETAVVVPPKNAKQLANGINVLLCDRDLASKISRNGLCLVKERFRWVEAAKAYVKLAEELDRLIV